jgi:predicted aspartyl protease
MIRGYLSAGTPRRPFVSARFRFPALDNRLHPVELLVDTGADRTILSPVDARRLGIALANLPRGLPSTGIGGQVTTRSIEAILTINAFSTPLTLPIPEMTRPIPSLLGRDILSRFALYLEERTNRVLLLESHEADNLGLPY